MTTEEKNIKICEALGWRREFIHGNGVDDYVWIDPLNQRAWFADGTCLPNHFADLNACHEMEKVLDEKQEWKYLAKLVAQVSIGKEHTVSWNRERTYHATAAQRAEAFGLTLKLWKPGE